MIHFPPFFQRFVRFESLKRISAEEIKTRSRVRREGKALEVGPTCLAAEFEALQLQYQREVTVLLTYKGRKLDCGFRVDFFIENTVILELKSVEILLPVHEPRS